MLKRCNAPISQAKILGVVDNPPITGKTGVKLTILILSCWPFFLGMGARRRSCSYSQISYWKCTCPVPL